MKTERYLVLAATGLFLLALGSQMPPEQKSIDDISSTDIGERIQVTGDISGFQRVSQNIFFNLSDSTGELPVAMFSTSKAFSEGEEVRVTGEVTLYHGKLEIIADSVSRRDT